ncbi:MAG: nitrogen-specific signal transduction histidine kinase, partial [Patescibacteria group bacterium]
ESIEHLNKAYRLLNKHFRHDNIRLSNIYREFGCLYADNFNDPITALDYSFKSLSLKNPVNTCPLHSNIASMYVAIDQHDKALSYLIKAEEICKQNEDLHTLAFVYENYGALYYEQEKYEEAITYYKLGMKTCQTAYKVSESPMAVNFIYSYTMIGLAQTYLKSGDLDLIPELIDEIDYRSSSSNLHGCRSQVGLLKGELVLHNSEINSFKELFEQGIQFCSEHQLNDEKKKWLAKMVEVCEESGDYKAALTHSKTLMKYNTDDKSKIKSANVARVLENKEMEILVLENRNRDMQLKKEQIEQFAYIVAHDLKTPLNNISNFIGLFTNNYGEKVDKENKYYLDFVLDNSKKMHEMLDALLKYIDVVVVNEKSTCNVNLLLSEICFRHGKAIEEKSCTIEYDELPQVPISKNHLSTILEHLIKNALKFSSADRNCHVQINVTKNASEFTFEVIDNGIGIKTEYHEQVFQLFKQLDKTKYAGTGMGLAICKQIINTYGGEISIANNEAGGTTFVFTVPRR